MTPETIRFLLEELDKMEEETNRSTKITWVKGTIRLHQIDKARKELTTLFVKAHQG